MQKWQPRAPWPTDLVQPRRVGIDITPGKARGPRYRRVSKGLYVPAPTSRCGEQRILETACRLPHGGAVTGWASLRLAGAAFFDGIASDGQTPLRVPVALHPHQRLKADPSIRQIRGGICVNETRTRSGLTCTIAERAVLDAARDCRDVRDVVITMDMALVGRATTLTDLERYERGHGFRSGICRFRAALPLATNRSRSPRETEMRLIWLLDAQLPAPLCNWPVHDSAGTYLGSPDLLSPELGVYGEFDGADHRDREQHRIDVDRAEALREVGLEGFTLVGADLNDRTLAVRRMHAAVERAKRRGPGTWQIPDEAPLL